MKKEMKICEFVEWLKNLKPAIKRDMIEFACLALIHTGRLKLKDEEIPILEQELSDLYDAWINKEL